MRILWLPSWYPSRLKKLNGDFIQRHAQAVSIYDNVDVVYVERDEHGVITGDVHYEKQTTGNLNEHIYYYFVKPSGIKWIEKVRSYRKSSALYKKAISAMMTEKEKPVLVHCYIALKAGLMALWAKEKFYLPYVLTEQWTVYLEEARPGIKDLPFYFRNKLNNIIKNAAAVSVVSEYLGKRLKEVFKIKDYTLIPNVVNSEIFKPLEKPGDEKLRLIHISGLDYQKNPEDILKALSIVNKTFQDFVLNIVGPENNSLKELLVKLGLSGKVEFLQEMLHPQLVEHMRMSDALILYSRYETFGCVIIEAQACGLPVFVSDIPVLHENVVEDFNGIIATAENPEALAAKILEFAGEKQKYRKNEISQYAHEHYSYQKIGKMFHDWYLSRFPA